MGKPIFATCILLIVLPLSACSQNHISDLSVQPASTSVEAPEQIFDVPHPPPPGSCFKEGLNTCVVGHAENGPTIATVTTSNGLGGEARFVGELGIRDGCLVAITGAKIATPIFDRDVVLQPDRGGVDDIRHGLHIPIGKRFSAGGAWLRENGSGWSIADIERVSGAQIPVRCSGQTVIRLHDFHLEE